MVCVTYCSQDEMNGNERRKRQQTFAEMSDDCVGDSAFD
jgi:hypothetical protein